MKKKIKVIIYIVILCVLCRTDLSAQSDSVSKVIDFQTKKFRAILEAMYEYSKDTIDIYTVTDSAFSAMLKSAHNYNAYYPKSIWNQQFNSLKGETESIGIKVKELSDTIFIYDVDENSPAYKAGIRCGNVLIAVNDIPATKENKDKIVEALSAEEGDSIIVKWMNYYSLELHVDKLICEKYFIPSITTDFIFNDNNILYMKIDRFTGETGNEIQALADKLKKKKIKGVIVDLRNNMGGTLNTVLKTLDEFIPKGDTIFKSLARKDEFKYNIVSNGTGSFIKTPLIVLINGKSASGSEVFSGAVQDLDRGIIIGEPSFRKGTMQKTWSLVDSTGYRITVAEFVTPSGRIIDKNSKVNKVDTNMVIDQSLEVTNKKLYDELNEKLKSGELRTSVNVLKSKKKNRTIIAGGGVYPDIQAKDDTLTLLTRVLGTNGIMIEFIIKNIDLFPKAGNMTVEDYIFNYNVSDELMEKLKVFSHDEKHIWNDEMYAKDKELIRNKFKSYIAHYLWGNSAFNASEAVNSKVVQQSLINMQKAVDILK